MRIVLIGQAAFGEKVLEALLERGEEVVGVFCPPDPVGKASPLAALGRQRGVPVYQPRRMRDAEVAEIYAGLHADLNVMAFVTDIVPQPLLDAPPCGTIQYHPSLLPRHRGGSAINWAIINGETRTGLTIFWPDAGIDTGPILLQREVEIGPDDTTGSLYFNKLFPLGVNALLDAVTLVSEGRAPRIPQDESLATHEPLCTAERTIIDWSAPAPQVYNLIRGANPQPGANTLWQGRSLKIFDCSLDQALTGAEPGRIVAIDGDGFAVAAAGGALHVHRVQLQGQPKQPAAEFAAAAGLVEGSRLGAHLGA